MLEAMPVLNESHLPFWSTDAPGKKIWLMSVTLETSHIQFDLVWHGVAVSARVCLCVFECCRYPNIFALTRNLQLYTIYNCTHNTHTQCILQVLLRIYPIHPVWLLFGWENSGNCPKSNRRSVGSCTCIFCFHEPNNVGDTLGDTKKYSGT